MKLAEKGVLKVLAAGALAAAGCATMSSPPSTLAAVEGSADVTQDCAGVATKERELGLLSFRDALGGSAPLTEKVQVSKTMKVDHAVGVRIAVRAQPGLTGPWLARVAQCHVALAAAGQLESLRVKDDPLLVPGVRVSVEEAYTGFIVSVRAPDAQSADDAMARATAMLASPPGSAVASK